MPVPLGGRGWVCRFRVTAQKRLLSCHGGAQGPDTWTGGDVASDDGLLELRGKAERLHPGLKGANTLSVTEGTRVAAKRRYEDGGMNRWTVALTGELCVCCIWAL